jgi:Proteolysis_6 C-terminal
MEFNQGEPVHSEDSTDEMLMNVDDAEDQVISIRNRDNGFVLLGEIDDSDNEELADSMDEAEEMIGFDGPSFGSHPAIGSRTDTGGSSDASSATPDDFPEVDNKFANVSQCPILPFQPTLLGSIGVGPGRSGSLFEYSNANEVMADMSHLGLIHRKDAPTFSLIRLPKSFVELYNIVNKVKGRDDSTNLDDIDDANSSETSICLLTGAVMRSGSTRRVFSRATRPPGACTLHARKTASGIGIFFLVQKCTVLLMHNNKSAYSPSLYVDEHGEEDPQLRRGRPLFLNEARYRALELLWRQQGIPREVAQIRSTSDRVIRDNWY